MIHKINALNDRKGEVLRVEQVIRERTTAGEADVETVIVEDDSVEGELNRLDKQLKAHYDSLILAKEQERLEKAPNVLWFHQDSHGFLTIDLNAQRAKVDWFFVSSIREKNYEVLQPYSTTIWAKSAIQ